MSAQTLKTPAEHPGTVRISARNIVKSYTSHGRPVRALDDVSLNVAPGKMTVLLGPSGCGKTTLLRSIAGLEQPQEGEITINGRLVYSAEKRCWLPPEQRNISMVFQSYALWPHMTVQEIVAFPLVNRKVDRTEIAKRVAKTIEAVGLAGLENRKPAQLSGGQQQRVALARAIVGNDGVVLFDEPLSNVDAQVRDQIRREILRLQAQLGFSGIYVTHDQAEATALADELVVMDHGRVVQVGAPSEIYDAPKTRYVAGFMGTSNTFDATVTEASAGRCQVSTPIGPVWGSPRDAVPGIDGKATLLFRPEAIVLHSERPNCPNVWAASIVRTTFMGSYSEITLGLDDFPGHEITATVPKSNCPEGARTWIELPQGAAWVFEK